jgi:FK506-binding nuclear protein
MLSVRKLVLTLLVTALLAACGQPNASDVPGALAPSSPSSPSPTPTLSPPPTAAKITTPCTHGQTKLTPNRVRVRDTRCGTGAEATRGSVISVKYVGKLATGQVFDSTKRHGGKPYTSPIGVGRVIPGWDEGVPGMRVGGVRQLVIPPAMAYGQSGAGPIPPNATLVFTIKLVKVKKGG